MPGPHDLQRRDVHDARDGPPGDSPTGPAALAIGGAAARRRGRAAASARASSAVRSRPVRTMPPTKPQVDEQERRRGGVASSGLSMCAAASAALGSVTVRTPSRRSAAMPLRIDGVGELEGPQKAAVAALDLMVMARRLSADAGRPRPADGQPVVMQREIDLLARDPGHLGRDDVAVVGLIDVDRREPTRSRAARRGVRAVPAMRADPEEGRRA